MTNDDFFNSWKKNISDSLGQPPLVNSGAVAKAELLTSRPLMYQVWLFNDDYTPMDFVVFVLEKIFHKTAEEATAMMLTVHNEGQAVCGSFTREVAETKVIQVIDFARTNEYPLKCVMSKDQEHVIKKS